jgi:hypothetical protein
MVYPAALIPQAPCPAVARFQTNSGGVFGLNTLRLAGSLHSVGMPACTFLRGGSQREATSMVDEWNDFDSAQVVSRPNGIAPFAKI